MNNLKKIIGLIFFTVYDGFNHKKNYSEVNFNFPKFNHENFFSNKYLTLYNLKIYFFNLIKYLIFPLALILKFLNFKIILVNPHSIGSCIEELDVVLKSNFAEKKYKLILFCPKFFSHNTVVIKTLYSKNVLLLYNPLWTILITPLSFYKSITISPYTDLHIKEKIIFPKQYFNAKNNGINFFYREFAHFILFEKLLKYESLVKKLDFNRNFYGYEDSFLKLKERHKINDKICVIHIRNENNYNLRNVNIDNYYSIFDLLIENNYKIILYYNSEISKKYNKKILHFKNLNENDKLNQLLFIYNCDLYIGNYSGPFHIVDIFRNDTIVLNTVVFNHFVRKNNFINVPKKYFDKKLNKFLNINEIFKRNIECVWDEKTLSNLNIEAIDLDNKEMLEVINFYLNKKKNFFNMSEFSFYKNIPYNKNLAINYIPKLNFLKDIFEK